MGEWLNLANKHYGGCGKFDIPQIKPIYDKIEIDDWKSFTEALLIKPSKKIGVNFYSYDNFFERLWNFPNKYLKVLKKFGCVISPDFSIYRDFPKAIQIYNHYRNHWMGRYFQDYGIKVIPNVGWSDESSYDWCFDGNPKNSIVAVSNIGCMKEKEAKRLFKQGYNEMLKRLEPRLILIFGESVEDYDGNFIHIKTQCNSRSIDDNRTV